MDDQTQQDHKPSESSAMSTEDQNAPGHHRQHHSPGSYPQHPSQPSSYSTKHKVRTPHDRRVGLGISSQDVPPKAKAEQTSQPTERVPQNRAPFGKWKSKMIYGFPDPETPLPPEITATQICESYPNHVNDDVILALMREGKGAKAIDALIPAPPGKEKAGQSHSKIQLRISTIREAFPLEDFPITSTKRRRTQSKSLEGQGIGSKDEGEMSFDVSMSPNYAAAGPSSIGGPHIGRARALDFLEGLHRDSPVTPIAYERLGDSNFPIGSPWSPSQTQETPSHLRAESLLASSPPGIPSAASQDEIVLLREQIRREYQRHLQLAFDIFYIDQPLPPLEMKDTIRAHCAEQYDSMSQELQVRCGSKLNKTIMPNGQSEHPISYLERSIGHCFGILPELQKSVVLDCPEDQRRNRREAAVLRNLLDRLHQWTVTLELKLETQRQIRAHKNAHAAAAEDRGRGLSDQGTANLDPELSIMEQSHQSAGNVGKGPEIVGPSSVSEAKDQTMTDVPETSTKPKHEFEEYMEEANQFVNREARATKLPSVSALSPNTTIRIFKPPAANITLSSPSLSTLSDDNFILRGWELQSRHVFGDDAEARVAEQRNELFEIGENEMRKYVRRGLEIQGEDASVDADAGDGEGGNQPNWKGKGKAKEVHFDE